MGICGARRDANKVLVGGSVSIRYGQLQELRRHRRRRTTDQGRQLQAKSVWTVRYGRQRRSVGRGLLAQKLPGGSGGRFSMGRERMPLTRHSVRFLEE